MKNVKFLLVIALSFALFMVYGPVKADQAGGPVTCNSDKCDIKIEKVNPEDALAIDPEILTIEDGNVLFAISAISNSEEISYDNFIFEIVSDYESAPSISNAINGYAPNSIDGRIIDMKYTTDNSMAINQVTDTYVGNNYSVIGYLVVKEEYADTDFSVSFVSDYFNYGVSDVTLNGIKYDSSDIDAISTDIFFGDFRFNFVVDTTTDSEGYTSHNGDYGYWEPVNGNSNKIIIDNTNSISDLYCTAQFFNLSNSDVKMSFYEVSDEGMGDQSSMYYLPNSNKSVEKFFIDAGKTKKIGTTLYGGNEDVAKEILKGDGKIGTLSLYVSNEQE